ncbi:MAG: hypothetical protein CAPSK01_001275 [Candidatus Accumulibacter vicinus]|uniref:Uncharacterized protein n=1 Tax=Candidatus Accumulibacter vicinus TaxID=2954382 RepID=A0A084Y2Z0_9PROT|nr:MAG: hypothetical protein CAPSK01_001275 [Candidatus Accumulibacter vicinus]
MPGARSVGRPAAGNGNGRVARRVAGPVGWCRRAGDPRPQQRNEIGLLGRRRESAFRDRDEADVVEVDQDMPAGGFERPNRWPGNEGRAVVVCPAQAVVPDFQDTRPADKTASFGDAIQDLVLEQCLLDAKQNDPDEQRQRRPLSLTVAQPSLADQQHDGRADQYQSGLIRCPARPRRSLAHQALLVVLQERRIMIGAEFVGYCVRHPTPLRKDFAGAIPSTCYSSSSTFSGGRPSTARSPRTTIGRSIRIGCVTSASSHSSSLRGRPA